MSQKLSPKSKDGGANW